MVSTTSQLLLTIVTIYLLNVLICLIRNIRLAQASGIPYLVVPYYWYNRAVSFISHRTVLRLLTKVLGEASPTSRRTFITATWPWKHRHQPFAQLGTDTFLTVAPGGILLHTADADVISQVTSRQTDFPKPSHIYTQINVYGENVLAAEGPTWRYHRRLMSPSFGENNNRLVWSQSLRDSQAMLSGWLETSQKPIKSLAEDAMLLSLSVIGRAGLGQTIEWPKSGKRSEELPLPGHTMTFTTALRTLLRRLYYIVGLPQWFLRRSPFKVVQTSYLAYVEWGQYLREIVSSKRELLAQSQDAGASFNDLLSRLLKEHEISNQNGGKSASNQQNRLTDSDILGNLFVMLLAGHETSANSIHFCLVLLAMHPKLQTEVQTELDSIFYHRSPSEWSYDKDLPKLQNSKLNAVLNEQLRILGPVITTPKYTTSPQTLEVNGKTATIPPKTIIRLCNPSVHRNPACWPSSSSDLDTFRPSRWFNEDGSWYTPRKGAYIPFSDGARACLGRRFAQVEILAVLALILSSHSIELAVDDEDDKTQDSNSPGEARDYALWLAAKERAEMILRHKMTVIITLQMQKGICVPVHVVKRGEERFAHQTQILEFDKF